MSYLKGAAARAIALQEIQNCAFEWRRLYRNAELHDFPYEDGEEEIFWEHLSFSVEFFIEDLQELLKAEFGVNLRILRVTGGGKTWMPVFDEKQQKYEYRREFDPDWIITIDEWVSFDSRCEVCEETFPEPEDVEIWAAEWNAARDEFSTAAKILKKINEVARSEAAGVAEWWKQEREALIEIGAFETETEEEMEYETEPA